MRKLGPKGPSFDSSLSRIPPALALRFNRLADISSGPLVLRPYRSSCFDCRPPPPHMATQDSSKATVPQSGVSSSRDRLSPAKNCSRTMAAVYIVRTQHLLEWN